KGGGAEGEIARHRLDLDPALIRAGKDPVYSAFCDGGEIPLFPAARELIELLAAAGVRLAIASGSYGRDVRALLEAHRLAGAFEAIVGKDDSILLKPHPDPYLIAARRLALPPASCVAVEDAEKGVLSARAAGMPVIVVGTEVTRGIPIDGADLRLGSLDELLDLVRGS
ncbi:MAG: HAD-IA family hydrolase, partial [Candidatus Krumholzibacteria bacterium]|nr:HAD-IA family hydrolase [Candidatus Krumholzibacteria bacterium]